MQDKDGRLVSRRDLLKGAAAGGVALAFDASEQLQAQTVPATATVSGTVFDEQPSGTGRTGIPGVLVSNGRDVVATDAAGHYTLPVTDETIIFVIKPSGYMTPLDPVTKLPKFYYIHQPKGSPASLGLTFEGIAPTGPLPASVDFALHRQDEPKAFDVVLFTDPQPETEAELDFVRDDVMSAIGGIEAKFGMTVGDMLFDDLSVYPRYNALIGTLGLPWYNVGGNHDLNFEAPDRHYARETYKRVFGPNYYAFCYADAVFLMLDDVDYLGQDKGQAERQRQVSGPARSGAARLRPQPAGPGSRRQADRRRDPYSAADLSRRRALPKPHQPCRSLPSLCRAPLYAEPVGPHPYDRASLFRCEGRVDVARAASSPCAHGPFGFLVERAHGSSRGRGSPTVATARRMAFMSCRSTATVRRRVSSRPRSLTVARSGSRSTAMPMTRCGATIGPASACSRESRHPPCPRPPSWPMSSTEAPGPR